VIGPDGAVAPALDETHAPELTSWVESAQDRSSDFPIQNLPFGVFSTSNDASAERRVGVAIGDAILDIRAAIEADLITGDALAAAIHCRGGTLNALMGAGPSAWRALRRAISALLSAESEVGRRASAMRGRLLVAQADAVMHLPAAVGDYTDFYASIYHATNVGSMFRPDNPLLPNYKWVPIGYHGRASSLVASGTRVRRPVGQQRPASGGEAASPGVGPSSLLDYECEVGMFVGGGNALGEPIPMASAESHVFGLCLVNDWSARDLQAWEYQPLGPFLAKNFATTLSPWVVTLDALAPFRAPAFARAAGDPAPLPYLDSAANRAHGGIAITLDVLLSSTRMREHGVDPVRLSRASFTDMYWTVAQMLAHHASNGCNLRPGDLLASGTVSGDARDARGCMLELTWRGTEPVALPDGESRRFLDDGDEVILRGFCEREGYRRIGFGECRGIVESAAT
jgi:fumarylacetoacetase